MKSVPKLIKRFVGILMLSSLLILVINFAVLAIITATQAPNGSPWTTAEQAAESMEKSEQGYKMSDEMIEELNAQNVWAVYIDNATGECVWHSDLSLIHILDFQSPRHRLLSLGYNGRYSLPYSCGSWNRRKIGRAHV